MLKSGFIVHPIKSEWIPKQEGKHLGFVVDLKQGLLFIPSKEFLPSSASYIFCSSQKTTASRISGLVGTIVSMGIAIGPVARVWTRSSYALVNNVLSWDSLVTLSEKLSAEIEFWLLCFKKFN